MNRILLTCALFFLLLTPLLAQNEAEGTARLDNGITVHFAPGDNEGMVSAMLVCPLPADATDTLLADASLIHRLLWHGGSALGRTVEEHEYRMFALRFGGSLSSRMLHDALVIQYTMPAELLEQVLTHMTVQWSALSIDEARLPALKQQIVSAQREATADSVTNQLLREIEKRIWADLSYSSHSFGSETELAAATPERINQSFAHIKNLSRWHLVVAGGVDRQSALRSMKATLGTLVQPEASVLYTDAGEEPILATNLQLPASLSRKHALLAYRLPAAGKMDHTSLILLVEALRRSPQRMALVEDLSTDSDEAIISISADLRKAAGLLTLSASWSSDAEGAEVLERLQFLTTIFSGEGPAEEVLEAATKNLAIRYWQRHSDPMQYAGWLGLRLAVGMTGDMFIEQLEGAAAASLAEISKTLLIPENRLTLVTVTR